MTEQKYFNVARAIAQFDSRAVRDTHRPNNCRYPVGSKFYRKTNARLREHLPTLFGMRLRAEYHRIRR